MKLSRGRNLKAVLESLFKQCDKSREYFKRKYKYLVKFYLRFYRRRRHTVVGNVLKFRHKRAVIAHNVLRIRGGLSARRQRTFTRVFYGLPISTRRIRKSKSKKKRKKKEKLPVQLQNVSSTTRPTISETTTSNGVTEKSVATVNDATADVSPAQPATKSIVIANSEEKNGDSEPVAAKGLETTPPSNEFDENSSTNNIWNLDLATVALEMTDENLPSIEDDDATGRTNGSLVNNISTSEPVSTSTPISTGNHSLFQLPADRQTSPVEDINEKLRRQLKLLKMGKPEQIVKVPTPPTPIITRISLRRNTIAAEPVKTSLRNSTTKSNEISTKSGSQDTSPAPTTNGSSRNSIDASHTPGKEATSKSKITAGFIDSLFNRLKTFGEQQTAASGETPTAISTRLGNKRRSNTPLNDARNAKIIRTSLDRRSKGEAASSPITVREMLQIKRMREQAQQEDEDNVSTCSSSNADFLGFDVTNKNIDVSALLPTPRVPKSSKESVFVSEDLDAFMKENSLENVANVEIVMPAKVGDVDEALITDAAQPPTLAIPERPVDMQRPRTLAEKRMILQRQQDVHYQMIEHESTVYHELKKRVKLGSQYNNQPLRSIQDAEIPFTRDCWRATCWINTDNNYFFYRTIACGANELKLAGGRGNNEKKLFCELDDDVDDVKMDGKPQKCKCPPIGKIKINNYEEHRQAVDCKKYGDPFASIKLLNNLKREYIRPCPLSKKPKVAKRTSLDIEYGQMEILTMPTVQLEVWPKVGEPLPDHLKPLMKTIMPEGNLITAEWAEFAVSVVVGPKPSPIHRPQKQQRKFKPPPPEERKSFVFDIPYVNNQTKIIVRRRRHPLGGTREGFREPIEAFYRPDSTALAFARKVDRSDSIASECADALSAMIDSVAVTINENNFIRNDPDLDYVGKLVPINGADTEAPARTGNESHAATIESAGKDKIVGTAKMDRGTSKLKVMKELKRLNVTIINAVPDEKPDDEIKREECKKTFCRLGCVCDSIAKATTMSNRCSNTKCIFDCKCSNSANQPHFNVPVDLLNKDLGNLHARATARLAKEEKDFTSTIVVSDHDMFVLPNSVRSTKRNTKKPKRYNECLANYDSAEEPDAQLQSPSPKRVRRAASNEYAYDQSIIDSLRHVNVQLKKLPELEVEEWCMVHCLYKCFCNGTAITGKPFSFTNANATDKAIDDTHNHVVDETTTMSSHWESIPPRRRQYSFDRGSTPSTSKPGLATVPTSSAGMTVEQGIAEQRTLRAARTRMFRWRIERKRRSVQDVRELRRQCDEVEYAYRDYLESRIEMCKQLFLREHWKQRAARDPKLGGDAVVPGTDDDIQFVAELRVPATYARRSKPETTVTQLNRVITKTMRTVCTIQRENILELNTEPLKITIVGWSRMLVAFRDNEIFVWDATLTDNSSVLLLTNESHDVAPVSLNIRSATNIRNVDNDRLPLVAKMLKMAVRCPETTQLAVLIFRLTNFWRVAGVMHSDKPYMKEGLHASPSADDNPELTQKIDQLHRLLSQEQHGGSSPAQPKAVTPVTAVPAATPAVTLAATPAVTPAVKPATERVTAKSNLTLENLQNINVSQLQLLLPIPLSKDQRWLMMTLGTDFTHIWLPQWRKFLSHKRIRSALVYAAQTRKTIELSPPNCHPSVFVTSVRRNQIFVGPYHMNEPQKLALFYRHEDGSMLLSENYAKLPNVLPFARRSIGSWIYTSENAASTNGTNKSKPNVTASAPPQPPPTATPVPNVNTQKPTSHLKIQNVFSIGHLANQMAPKEAGQSILKPISLHQNPVTNNGPSKNPVIRIVSNTPATLTQTQTVAANTAAIANATVLSAKASNANAAVTIARPSTANPPIIITKVSQQQQKGPVIASIRSYGEATMGKLPVISSIQSGEHVQQSLVDTQAPTASPSSVSEPVSEAVTLVDVLPVADATPSPSEATSQTNGSVEIIDVSDDEEDNHESEMTDASNVGNTDFSGVDPLTVGKVTGYIICPMNKDLGKIPAEIDGNSITLRIGSCDKEAELPLNLDGGNESFDCLSTVDKYMSQLISTIACSVHPKNHLFRWKFCPEISAEHKSLPIHSTKSLNSYSVVFSDISLSIESNYSARTDLLDPRKYILDVEKLALKVLPRPVAKECQLKDVIMKATELEKKLEGEQIQLAALKDRYSRMISAKVKLYRMLQNERKAVARAHEPE